MPSSTGSILIRIGADIASLRGDMGKVSGIMDKSSRRMIQSFKTVGLAIVAALGAHNFAALIKGTLDAGDSLAKLSQKTGVSVEDLSALEYSAGLAGADITQLANGIKLLSKNMYDVSKGTGEAKIALDDMGLTVMKASGGMKSAQEVMLEVSDSFKGMADGALKSALAQKIFGKSGADMIPFLNQGSAAIQDQREELEKLGGLMTTEMAKASEIVNDNMSRLGTAVKGVAIEILSKALPAMVDFTNQMVSWLKESGAAKRIGDALVGTFKLIASTVIVATAAFRAIGIAIGGVASGVFSFITGDFAGAIEIFKSIGPEIGAALDKATVALGNLSDPKPYENIKTKVKETKEAFTDLGKAVKKVAMNDLAVFLANQEAETTALLETQQARIDANQYASEAIEELRENDYGKFLAAQELETNALIELQEKRVSVSKDSAEQMTKFQTGLRDYVLRGANQMADAIVAFATGAKFSFKSFVEAAIADIIRLIAQVLILKALVGAGLGGFLGLPFSKGGAISGGNVLSPFAKGGVVRNPTIFPMQSGMGLMGEAGPEAILPLARTRGGDLGVKTGGGAGGQTIQLLLDGRELARWFHDSQRDGTIQLRPA